MYPKGTIYPVTTPLHAPIKTRVLYKFLRIFGLLLFLFPLFYIVFIFGPVIVSEVNYSVKTAQAVEPSPPPRVDKNLPQVDEKALTKAYAEELGLDTQFSLYVPKIDAKTKVIANVDPGNPKDYQEILKEGVAHSRGTNYPGEGKLVYMFSHSTNSAWWAARYGAQFYLLNKMEPGDEIIVFYSGEKYTYKVTETIVVSPSEVSWLTDQGKGEMLILQTCTPAGTTQNRLLVIAKPI
jgi:LPXTG-site transpeptidase (sortase) family protein